MAIWNLRCKDDADYAVDLSGIEVKDRIMLRIFNKAKKKVKRKTGLDVKGKPEVLDAFDVDTRYFNLLKVAIHKIMREIENDTKKDGIELLNFYIKKARFVRKKDGNWDVQIRVIGQYVDKR